MQFEAIEPAPAALAALRQSGKDFVRVNAAVMTDPEGKTVNKLNASGLGLAGLQKSTKGQNRHRNQLDKPGVAGQTGKLRSFPRQHRAEIVSRLGAAGETS